MCGRGCWARLAGERGYLFAHLGLIDIHRCHVHPLFAVPPIPPHLQPSDPARPTLQPPLSTSGRPPSPQTHRVENEDREPDPTLLHALESFAAAAIGSNWGAALDVELIANLGRYRRYDYTCLRDLLRVVRNKRNHFREMPDSLQQLMGPLPNGFYRCVWV